MRAHSIAPSCAPVRGRRRPLILASSPRASYDLEPDGDTGDVGAPGGAPTAGVDAQLSRPDPSATAPETSSEHPNAEVVAVARVLAAVEAVGAVDLAALGDARLDAFLAALRRPLAVLEAARAGAMAAVERRVRRAADPDRVTGALLESRRRAAKDQRMSPSEAKRSAEAGAHAAANPVTGRAFSSGDVGPSQVRLLGDALQQLPAERRGEAEQVLLEAARTLDPVAFGRRVRGYLAEHSPQELHPQEQANHRRRRFRIADTEDGGVAFSGLAYGTAAELARTALQAFRRPDTPDEHRSPEQRGADAFEQLCDAALRLGAAPKVHGQRPQVMLVVEESELAGQGGAGRFAGSQQPVTLAEAGTLLTDCVVSRVVRRADGTPIEVTRNVRTVPKGLWRALLVRDGGCRWDGCDAPASWCDVAHGQHPYRFDGKLSPANATLLCRRHHRRFDKGPWRLEINGDQVTFHRKEATYAHPLDQAANVDATREEPVAGTGPGDREGPAVRAGPGDRQEPAVRAGPGDRQEPAVRAGPGAEAGPSGIAPTDGQLTFEVT